MVDMQDRIDFWIQNIFGPSLFFFDIFSNIMDQKNDEI